MSKELQLRKGGRLFVKEWDFEKNDYIDEKVSAEEFIFHIYDTICFDRDVKLRDFFLMVNENIEFCSIITGCPFIEDLISEALHIHKKCSKNISALRISWISVIVKDDEGESIEDYASFHAIGDKEYEIEFTPINELSLYPIIIDESYVIKNKKDKTLLQTKKKYRLIDILKTIIDELSYMGPPEMREFAFEEMKKQIDENISILSQEELDKKFKRKMKKNKKPCILCKRDARSPCFGKPENICAKCYQKIKEN